MLAAHLVKLIEEHAEQLTAGLVKDLQIRTSGLVNTTVDLYQFLELNRLVGQFFDKATYYTVWGYEHAARHHEPHLAAHGH
jgi:hypothetical protein